MSSYASGPLDLRDPGPPPERPAWQKLKPNQSDDPLRRSMFAPASPPKRQPPLPMKLISDLRVGVSSPCEIIVEVCSGTL